MILKIFVLFYIITCTSVKAGVEGVQFFEVLLDRFENIYVDESYFGPGELKFRRINKTRAIVGEIQLKQPLGNDILVDITTFKKQGGEYRKLPYEFLQKPFCDFYGGDIYVYPDLAKSSNFPADLKETCPLKPGTYKSRGAVFELKNMPKVIVPSGDYATEGTYFKNGVKIAQVRIYATINTVY